MEVTGHIGQPLLLKLECQNYKAYAKSDNIIEQAISLPTTKQNIYDQLNKLNNTPYRIGNFIVNLDDKAFIPLKEINELRRKAIANLDSIRLHRKTSLNKPNNIIPQKFDLHRPEISVQVYTQEQYEAAKELEIEHIYYKNFIHRNNPKYIDDDKEILFGGLGSIDYYKDKNKILSDVVTEESVYEVISKWTNIPISKLASGEKEKMLHLEDNMKKRVMGQDEAIKLVSEAIIRARSGIKDENRPIGSFIFLGPTGVGKTEVARTLAYELFDDEKPVSYTHLTLPTT